MGTEVLFPQDILGNRRLVGFGPSSVTISADASLFPRRRVAPNCCSSSGGGVTGNPRPRRRPESRRRSEGSPRPAAAPAGKVGSGGNGGRGNLVMGQVTILRRGESLDSVTGKGLSRKAEKEGKRAEKAAAPVVLSSESGGDLIVFGTGRLGPEPASVPKQLRLVGVRTGTRAERAEMYAGPAFSLSPSPRALPLPTFSSRKPGECGADEHQSATRDLRRLLRLD
ncbi:hypothetical protein Taro_008644 [Colocasia esculenta]|uniref:Uncharacterized protein n=1 Tax=Colocasia esculenta TaxID=4460 RepID=A0A843U400_COLES|nr:hypothetical protein [Colocasia esculenta]